MRELLVCLCIAGLACSSGGNKGETTPDEAAPPVQQAQQGGLDVGGDAGLPRLAAGVIRTQMARHGQRIEGLQWAAIMLDHQETQNVATQIANEPRIARPIAGDDTINQPIPEAFYQFHDQLHKAAGMLSIAAAAKDNQRMIKAYGQVASTCIGCHSLYVRASASFKVNPAQNRTVKLRRAKPLPIEARDALNSSMYAHAEAMEETLTAALALDYAALSTALEKLMDGPKVVRPTAGPQSPLNLPLPADFFDLQDQLYQNADALARAAKAKDDSQIAESFTAVSATCMSCHSLYLGIEPSIRKSR